MKSLKRSTVDRDLGSESQAKQALLNAMIRAQSLLSCGQLHTAMAILETEMRKIRATLNSKIK
jgi:uncharacterized small protein (DUF1192 family)